jgi:hypothetical protein
MAVVGHVDLHIADYEPVQSVLAKGAVLADVVGSFLRDEIGRAELVAALREYRAAVGTAAEAVKEPEPYPAPFFGPNVDQGRDPGPSVTYPEPFETEVSP